MRGLNSTIPLSPTSVTRRSRIFFQVLVGHFASAETQAGLTLSPSERNRKTYSFRNVIVLVDVDAEFYFFQDDLFLVLFRRPFLFFLPRRGTAIVHDAGKQAEPRWRRSLPGPDFAHGLSGRILRLMMPSCSPSAPITRISRARMRSFILIKRLSMRSS